MTATAVRAGEAKLNTKYRVVDADGHVLEPPTGLWERAPREYKERMWRVVPDETGTEWYHSVQDPAAIVRDFVKWDDYPVSLQHFAESTVRAYKIATTPPMEPVMIGVDIDLQEEENREDGLRIPKLARSRPARPSASAAGHPSRVPWPSSRSAN